MATWARWRYAPCARHTAGGDCEWRRAPERHAAVGRPRMTGTSIKEIHMQGKITLFTLPFLFAVLAAATPSVAFNDAPGVPTSADAASAKAGGLLQGRLNVRYGDGRPGPGRTSKTWSAAPA